MYSHEQLKSFIKGEIIGESYPYDTKDEKKIEAYIKQLYNRMKRIPNVFCEAEFDHFGSGYASFIEFFCYRREDIRIIKKKEKYGILEYEIKGILINVSRLAPIFIYGEDERARTVRVETKKNIAGAYSPLPGQTNIFHMDEKFSEMMYELFQVLKEFKYEPLAKTYANQVLPFEADIPTFYREPHEYRVLDALFYWED